MIRFGIAEKQHRLHHLPTETFAFLVPGKSPDGCRRRQPGMRSQRTHLRLRTHDLLSSAEYPAAQKIGCDPDCLYLHFLAECQSRRHIYRLTPLAPRGALGPVSKNKLSLGALFKPHRQPRLSRPQIDPHASLYRIGRGRTSGHSSIHNQAICTLAVQVR